METNTKKMLFAVLIIAVAFVSTNLYGITGDSHKKIDIEKEKVYLWQNYCGWKDETRCDFSGIYTGVEPNREGSVVGCNDNGEIQLVKKCLPRTKCILNRGEADCEAQDVNIPEYGK